MRHLAWDKTECPPLPPTGADGTIAKVGFCRKPAFYLPVAGSRAPEMAL